MPEKFLPIVNDERDFNVKVAADAASVKYYNGYIKTWEANWIKHAAPVIETEDQLKAEEKEIQESMAFGQEVQRQSEIRQTDRFTKETDDFKASPLPGVKLDKVL